MSSSSQSDLELLVIQNQCLEYQFLSFFTYYDTLRMFHTQKQTDRPYNHFFIKNQVNDEI